MKSETITNETIFTINWAKEDPRSVKAYLDGRGDWRTLWWQLNCTIHRLLRYDASLEEVMLSYHSRHRRLTRSSFGFTWDFRTVLHAIICGGVTADVRQARTLAREERSPA